MQSPDKSSHRLPRQCLSVKETKIASASLAGIRADKLNYTDLPKHLFMALSGLTLCSRVMGN